MAEVGTDLLELKGSSYLFIVDYYSRFIEIARMNRITAEEVTFCTKETTLDMEFQKLWVLGNGPQFSSEAYAAFV